MILWSEKIKKELQLSTNNINDYDKERISIFCQGGIEPILRGIIGTAASAVSSDKLLAEEVTERLVVIDTTLHMDLASLNLQRGRDHGLPGKNSAECQFDAIEFSLVISE